MPVTAEMLKICPEIINIIFLTRNKRLLKSHVMHMYMYRAPDQPFDLTKNASNIQNSPPSPLPKKIPKLWKTKREKGTEIIISSYLPLDLVTHIWETRRSGMYLRNSQMIQES